MKSPFLRINKDEILKSIRLAIFSLFGVLGVFLEEALKTKYGLDFTPAIDQLVVIFSYVSMVGIVGLINYLFNLWRI